MGDVKLRVEEWLDGRVVCLMTDPNHNNKIFDLI